MIPSPHERLPRQGLLLLAALSLFWGANWPIMKMVLSEVPPLYFRGACLLLGGGIAAMFAAENGRAVTGLGTLSTRLEPTDVLMLRGADSWDGSSIDVAWIEPAVPVTSVNFSSKKRARIKNKSL